MTLTREQREDTARLLREAERQVAPVDPLSALLPGMEVADAYAVQRDNVARRLAAGAEAVAPAL